MEQGSVLGSIDWVSENSCSLDSPLRNDVMFHLYLQLNTGTED